MAQECIEVEDVGGGIGLLNETCAEMAKEIRDTLKHGHRLSIRLLDAIFDDVCCRSPNV